MTASDEIVGTRPYDLAGAAHDYQAWEGAPKRSIVICTHPRSGSTLLGEALVFAGGLGLPLEYFHRGFRPAFERRWQTAGIDQLVRAAHHWRTDPSGVFAAKLFWVDIEEIAREIAAARFGSLWGAPAAGIVPQFYRDMWAAIAHMFPNPTFIHLVRRDRIRQAVSSLVAEQSGLWRAIPMLGTETARQDTVYDFRRIQAFLGLSQFAHEHWTKLFAAIGAPVHTVFYEDLDRDYETTVRNILDRLGSNAAVPARRMRRQSDTSTESLVLRFLRDNEAAVRQ